MRKIKNFPNFLKFSCFGLIIFVFFGAAVNCAKAADKIVAIVNNDVITQKDLDDFLRFTRLQLSKESNGLEVERKIAAMKGDLLNKLIEDKVILQEAKKSGLRIDENRIKSRIDEIKKRYTTLADFQADLAKQGLVEEDLVNRFREQLLMYQIVEFKVKYTIVVNPTEVTDYYTKHIDEFKIEEGREVDSITCGDEPVAKQIASDLRSGEDASKVAEKYSLAADSMNIHRGGEFNRSIEDAVFGLKDGEVADPIKIGETYYILKLKGIMPPRQERLADVQDAIYSRLYDEKMQEQMLKWLDDLKKQSYIKIL